MNEDTFWGRAIFAVSGAIGAWTLKDVATVVAILSGLASFALSLITAIQILKNRNNKK